MLGLTFSGTIQTVLSIFRNETYWILLAVAAVVIAVLLFFINFKRKTGLIYVAVPFAIIGIVLLGIGFSLAPIVRLLLPEYESIIKPIYEEIKTTFLIEGIIYIAITAGAIVATRLLAKKKPKQKADKAKAEEGA